MKTNYDAILQSRLKHLEKHPNYLPHIGKNFEQALQRIMIVAESHYVPENFDGLVTTDSWHNEPERIYSTLGKSTGWFHTRGVLQTYFSSKKVNKLDKGLTIFRNLETAYKTVFKNEELMDECVYINYYQRPAEKHGDSISVSSTDSKIAVENLLVLIEVLKIGKVIFVSSKAYKDFISVTTLKERANLPYIGSVPHPSASSWWNRESKKYGINGESVTGKAKFKRIIMPKLT